MPETDYGLSASGLTRSIDVLVEPVPSRVMLEKGIAMGNPLHFSLELPQRCLQLIDELWPYVENVRQPNRRDLGSLTTTFLLSMSIPIINLPVERIERHRNAENDGYADDRCINPKVAAAVLDTLGGKIFDKAPFYRAGEWSFAMRDGSQLFNIAKSIPDDLASELASEEAAAR